jgi:CheY-like chemotaxis protein
VRRAQVRKAHKIKTILLLEDDEDIRSSLVEALIAEGYEVVTATNGEEGVNALRDAASDLPDLIILDLMMPVKDGIEFRLEQQAEPRWKEIPVIVMTADTNAIRQLEAVKGSYLRKPVDLDDLLLTIQRQFG